MRISIYQINTKRDALRVAFLDHSFLEEHQGSADINSSIYDKVYSDKDVEGETLEDIYRVFNLQHPDDYSGRSMSISDIVEVISGGTVSPGFYYCDGFGFLPVEFNPNKTTEKES